MVGDVTQEFLIENDFSSECGWSSFLQKGVAHWINYTTQRKVTKFKLISSWVIRQFKGEYNPIHWHGGHISGVAYLKLPVIEFRKDQTPTLNLLWLVPDPCFRG